MTSIYIHIIEAGELGKLSEKTNTENRSLLVNTDGNHCYQQGNHNIPGQVEDTFEESQEDHNFYHILEGPTYNETFPTHKEEEENVYYVLEDNDREVDV